MSDKAGALKAKQAMALQHVAELLHYLEDADKQ